MRRLWHAWSAWNPQAMTPPPCRILCSNRDEFLARPTAPAHWHAFGPISGVDNEEGPVLSGRDLLAGGTWAGVSRAGRLALLCVDRAPDYVLHCSSLSRTNITEPIRKYESSRGDLTSSFLLPKDPQRTLQAEIDEFLLENRGRAYAGFNLLLLSPSIPATGSPGSGTLSLDGAFATNSGGGGPITARMLTKDERRCGGMSNGVDHHGASEWPKVKHGIQTLDEVLNSLPQDATEAEIVERLFTLLTWVTLLRLSQAGHPPHARATWAGVLTRDCQVEKRARPPRPIRAAQHDFGRSLAHRGRRVIRRAVP